jgi:molybdate transport system regulatory protein
MMVPRFNLWIEHDGEVVLSAWRVKLLQAVKKTGSISAAADEMDVPYRRAWERIREMEKRLGSPLLKTEVGGEGGGGAVLTSIAGELIERFNVFAEGMEQEVGSRFQTAFGEIWEAMENEARKP